VEGKEPEGQQATKYVSKGLTRSRTDNLVVMRGGSSPSPLGGEGGALRAPGGGAANVTALSSSRVGDTLEGATALKQETDQDLSPTERLEQQQWSKAGTAQAAAPSKAERRAEAKAKGYEGDMCSECSNFTLVRNGTCMKCDTCGSTTGCS
jgi:ribonucleoside-diphosphate reductase alpha chain